MGQSLPEKMITALMETNTHPQSPTALAHPNEKLAGTRPSYSRDGGSVDVVWGPSWASVLYHHEATMLAIFTILSQTGSPGHLADCHI